MISTVLAENTPRSLSDLKRMERLFLVSSQNFQRFEEFMDIIDEKREEFGPKLQEFAALRDKSDRLLA